MTETPTPDEIARWAALAESATPGPWERDSYGCCVLAANGYTVVEHAELTNADAEFIAAARDALPRLLALVAAQAEQNAELRGEIERLTNLVRLQADFGCNVEQRDAAANRADKAEAALSALRATDEYQRWARAVTERDAARERITKALQFVNHELADAVLTEFDHGAHSALAVVRAALDQPTREETTG